MGTVKSCIALIAALALSAGVAACEDLEVVRGSGNVITEQFTFADFTRVRLQNTIAAEITRSDSFDVTVRADDNILDLLDVSREGDTLKMRLSPGVQLRGDVTLEATITMPDLDRLHLSGASTASVSGFSSQARIDIRLSGASSLEGDLEARELDLEVSGASDVSLVGTATEITIDGSGASRLDIASFVVDIARVDLSGATEATVTVIERIDSADVSGASTLRYLGDPELGNVTTSGASSVEKVER